jgi:hypothetical protein
VQRFYNKLFIMKYGHMCCVYLYVPAFMEESGNTLVEDRQCINTVLNKSNFHICSPVS